ncbi:MAG: STAS domain-containing protein [Candidatus Melainabacteria bacterium]|nr:STAS domain-containing protein [Candidatus Melainabacteria bacterium]
MIALRMVDDIVILDMPNSIQSDLLNAEVQAQLQAGHKQMGINLTELAFVESSGLGALVTAYKTYQAAGGNLAIYALQPYVQKLVELTKLNRLLPIYETEDDALSALKQPA